PESGPDPRGAGVACKHAGLGLARKRRASRNLPARLPGLGLPRSAAGISVVDRDRTPASRRSRRRPRPNAHLEPFMHTRAEIVFAPLPADLEATCGVLAAEHVSLGDRTRELRERSG